MLLPTTSKTCYINILVYAKKTFIITLILPRILVKFYIIDKIVELIKMYSHYNERKNAV